MRMLLEKYKSIILYLIFGCLTTLVNIIVYWCCAHILSMSTILSNVFAWLLAVLFAYITNRRWVFESKKIKITEIMQEMAVFFGCRLATGIFDIVFMYIFVDIIHLNDLIIKVISNVIVIVLNYIASKMVIFKKR